MTEEDLIKRLKIANDEIQRLQRKNQALVARNQALEAIGKQWEVEKMSQSTIIHQQLDRLNIELDERGEEINKLRRKVKYLNGDID